MIGFSKLLIPHAVDALYMHNAKKSDHDIKYFSYNYNNLQIKRYMQYVTFWN